MLAPRATDSIRSVELASSLGVGTSSVVVVVTLALGLISSGAAAS